MNPEDLEEEDDVVTVEAAVGRGTPVDGSTPGRAGFRLPKALGGEEHELTLGKCRKKHLI